MELVGCAHEISQAEDAELLGTCPGACKAQQKQSSSRMHRQSRATAAMLLTIEARHLACR
jgi:hypothetical protein